jgi:hypothetical protein
MSEQRNPYKGTPARPWIRLVLVGADGQKHVLQALADTGNPCALVVSSAVLDAFNLGRIPGMDTNFGHFDGGWLRVQVPEIGFDEDILAYSCEEVAEAVRASHEDFGGLAGLPLLKSVEYGGNRDSFWLRATP